MHRCSALLFAAFLLWAAAEAIHPTGALSEPISLGIPVGLPEIECGQVIEGVLGPGDEEPADGTWVDETTFHLDEPTRVTFTAARRQVP